MLAVKPYKSVLVFHYCGEVILINNLSIYIYILAVLLGRMQTLSGEQYFNHLCKGFNSPVYSLPTDTDFSRA